MAITFAGDTKSAWVMSPDGGIVRAVVGGPINSEIVTTIRGSDGKDKVVLTATAADRGYRLMEEVFRTTYAGKKAKDGRDLGPALYDIWLRSQIDGQAGRFPDADLPAPVLEARKKWAAKRAAQAPAAEELAELLGRKAAG